MNTEEYIFDAIQFAEEIHISHPHKTIDEVIHRVLQVYKLDADEIDQVKEYVRECVVE